MEGVQSEGYLSLGIQDKYCLTLEEASVYFNISVRRFRDLIKEENDFALRNGAKVLIKRKRFEEFIDQADMI